MRLPFFNKSKTKTSPSSIRSSFTFSGGSYVSEDMAMEISAFHRGVIYISSQIAKLPWDIKDAKNNKVNNHKLSKIIKLAPNDEMNSMSFRLVMIQQALLHGNSYAEIERDLAGRIIGLHVLPSNNVDLVRSPEDGSLWYRILGGNVSFNGEDALLKPQDVYHIRNLHTKDGLSGQGIVAYAADTLGTAKGGDKFANSLFSNGGMPSGTLNLPGGLSDEAFKRLADGWKANHGGRKVGGTAILEEGATYTPVSFAPDVLQFLESRKFGVLEVSRFLGLPPTKLFDGDSATFSNIEQANLEVATDTLDAWARVFEMEADVKLLDYQARGYRTEMDLYAIFRGDMAARSSYFKSMMQTGAITPNQIREKEGESPYEGGDRYYIATNNFSPADRVDEIIDSQLKNSDSQDESTNEEKKTSKELNDAALNFLNKRN